MVVKEIRQRLKSVVQIERVCINLEFLVLQFFSVLQFTFPLSTYAHHSLLFFAFLAAIAIDDILLIIIRFTFSVRVRVRLRRHIAHNIRLERVAMRVVVHETEIQLIETHRTQRHRHTVEHHILVHETSEIFASAQSKLTRNKMQQNLPASSDLEPLWNIAIEFIVHAEFGKGDHRRLGAGIIIAMHHFLLVGREQSNLEAHAETAKNICVAFIVRRQLVVNGVRNKIVAMVVSGKDDILCGSVAIASFRTTVIVLAVIAVVVVAMMHIDIFGVQSKKDKDEFFERAHQRVVHEKRAIIGDGHEHNLVARTSLRHLTQLIVHHTRVPHLERLVRRFVEIRLVLVLVAVMFAPHAVVEENVVERPVHHFHRLAPEIDMLWIRYDTVLVLLDIVVKHVVHERETIAQKTTILTLVEFEIRIARIDG